MILQKRKAKVELICESYLSGALTCTGGAQKRADGVVSAKYSEIYFLVFCFYNELFLLHNFLYNFSGNNYAFFKKLYYSTSYGCVFIFFIEGSPHFNRVADKKLTVEKFQYS